MEHNYANLGSRPEPDTVNGNQAMGMVAERNPEPIAASKSIRDIHISKLSHGYVVTIGCQNFAIESASTLLAKLSEYVLNPAATEQKWNDGKLFN
jgi:hypothetical protein